MFCADLSGGQDGSVNLWEWNHQQELSTPQPPGKFGKVTRVSFNQLGMCAYIIEFFF